MPPVFIWTQFCWYFLSSFFPCLFSLNKLKKKKGKKSSSGFAKHLLLDFLLGAAAPPESCTSGSELQMMSRLAMTQSPPHREFLREVGCSLFSLPLPTWHLPAAGGLREPFEEACISVRGGLILTGQVGEGYGEKRRAWTLNSLKVLCLCHQRSPIQCECQKAQLFGSRSFKRLTRMKICFKNLLLFSLFSTGELWWKPWRPL